MRATEGKAARQIKETAARTARDNNDNANNLCLALYPMKTSVNFRPQMPHQNKSCFSLRSFMP